MQGKLWESFKVATYALWLSFGSSNASIIPIMRLGILDSWLYVSSRRVMVGDRKAVTIADMDAKLRNLRDSCKCNNQSGR